MSSSRPVSVIFRPGTDVVAIEGFVSVGGRKVQRFNSREEFERAVKQAPGVVVDFTPPSKPSDDGKNENDDLPF